MEARTINTEVYRTLGARWYQAHDDPVALLRAEAALRNPWVAATIERELGAARPWRLLDVGCGAGFLANDMAARGFSVTGVDQAPETLEVARAHDATGSVTYEEGNALALGHADGAFDAVCAMDFLEHVEEPERIVAEAARVLRPGGLFFFSTFDRNPAAWLIVIKGVEWFVKNTPRDLHILRLFIKPSELRSMCRAAGLEPRQLRGLRPRFDAAFIRMLRTREVPADFRFIFARSLRLAYCGYARRK